MVGQAFRFDRNQGPSSPDRRLANRYRTLVAWGEDPSMRWRWLIAIVCGFANAYLIFQRTAPALGHLLGSWIPEPRVQQGWAVLIGLGLLLPALWFGRRFPRVRARLGGNSTLVLVLNFVLLAGLAHLPPSEKAPVPSPSVEGRLKERPRSEPTPDSTPQVTKTAVPRIAPSVKAGPQRTKAAKGTYEAIDAHALAAPESVEHEVASLAAYLIEPASRDDEKARAIYRWVSDRIAYDAAAFYAHQHPDGSPENVLKTRLAVCEGYAKLAHALAQEAGLECELVSGCARGAERPGEKQKRENHAWNAVKIDGQWELMDTTWGSGFLDDNQQFQKKFNDFYFLIDPQRLRNTHLPVEESWQLSDHPMSFEVFLDQPRFYPGFYEMGLALEPDMAGTVHADPEAQIELSVPSNLWVSAQLLDQEQQEVAGATTVDRDGERAVIRVKAPKKGHYKVTAMVGPYTKTGATSSAVVDFKLEASVAGDGGFPELSPLFQQKQGRVLVPDVEELKAGRQRFDLEIPGAKAVFVDEWDRQLKKEGDRFSGEIDVARGEAKVFAQFDSDSNTASNIISFRVR